MGLHPPERRNLREFSSQDSNEVWNISAPEKKSLFWSILIPYLISSAENGTFRKNIKLLVGDHPKKKEENFEVVEIRVKKINPFKNIHTLYHDSKLTALMKILKKRINQTAGRLSREEANNYDNYLKLQAASNMLQCHINLYEESSDSKHLREYTPKEENGTSLKIIIFSRIPSSTTIYGFGLSENYSLDLRKDSLKHILRTAGLNGEEIVGILGLIPSENFLLSLMKSSLKHVIPTIYKSPYILKKLCDAGYEINPLSVGKDGRSAFYECMVLNDLNLYLVLYNYSSRKDYFLTENTASDDISTKLNAIRRVMLTDHQSRDLSLFCSESKSLRVFDSLMRFNQYHIELEKGISSIRNDVNGQNNDIPNKTILFIIDKYFEYFHYSDPKNEIEELEDFYEYYEYHRTVDDFTGLCFFDYFLSLKVKIEARSKSIFIEVLAFLFLYLLSPGVTSFQNFGNFSKKAKYFLPFCYRMKWKKALFSLSTELRSGVLEQKDSNIIKIVENCLTDYPLIKENFQLARLRAYLKIADEADFTNNKIKATQTILRTLQVIGETFNSKVGCTTTSLLQYCVPYSVVSALCDIRNNCLSHLHASCTQGRKKLEESSFLTEIQRELKDVAKALKPVFELQAFQVSEFMITYSIVESKKFNNDLFENLNDMKSKILDMKQTNFGKYEENYVSVASKMLNLIPEKVANKNIKTYNQLKIHCEGLKYLLIYLVKQSNCCHTELFIQNIDEFSKLFIKDSHEELSDNSMKNIADAFIELKNIFKSLFDYTHENTDDLDFKHLNSIFKIIREYNIFSSPELAQIRKSFSEFLENCIKQITDHFYGTKTLPHDKLDQCLKYVTENKKTKTMIKKNGCQALHLLKNTDAILGKDENSSELMSTLQGDKYRNVISELCLPKQIHDNLSNLRVQKLYFLLERMQYLDEILINDIKNLIKYGTSQEFRDHIKRLLMQRYKSEMDTKAALELLLLDCLEIYNKKEAFEDLFLKTSEFFWGINIRNILSHGCPIVEVSNDLLDHDNLPMEFINTALDLIEDRKALQALTDLWNKTGYQAEELRTFVNNDSDKKLLDLKKTIRKCERWEKYLFLFSS